MPYVSVTHSEIQGTFKRLGVLFENTVRPELKHKAKPLYGEGKALGANIIFWRQPHAPLRERAPGEQEPRQEGENPLAAFVERNRSVWKRHPLYGPICSG